ncbi:MAG: DUF692 domain-containing protein [Gammaproteobacteria bacterium]|nr:DUF692 domain-containing protein [Gammaproteobacteria bacterium]
MPATALTRPALGYGLGLRTTHYQALLRDLPPLDWLEVLSENYMVAGGKPLDYLDRIRAHYPVVMHGVSLSIGSGDPLDQNYLRQLKTLAQRIEPHWISDHLCWTGVQHKNMHDLLPLPYTEEALQHVVTRVKQVQDFLGQRILLENVSSYLTYTDSAMSEWEFLRAVCEQADCLLLLDINNIYVSARNHGFDPLTFLEAIPIDRLQQFHLAGHSMNGDMIIDTHDAPVIDPVWDLYAQAVRRFGAVSTLLERDDNIPELPELIAELAHARTLATTVLAEKPVAA